MDGKFTYQGMLKENIKFHFQGNKFYVEEFDTEDGTHHIWRLKREDWPDEVIQEAIEQGIQI